LYRLDLRPDAARQGRRLAAWFDADRLLLRRAYEFGPPLSRRHGRRPDGPPALHAEKRPAGRGRHATAGRALARLAESGPGLRAEPSRAHQSAAMVPRAAARADGRAGARAR